MKFAVLEYVRFFWRVLKRSFARFSEDDLFTYAAGLAYYTLFSLPPILLIATVTATSIYSAEQVNQVLFGQIGDLIGQKGASELAGVIESWGLYAGSGWYSVVSILILVFTATTVFTTIQVSLNRIFRVKADPTGWGILKLLLDRLLSFAMILALGFILLVSLTLNAVLAAFGDFLSESWPEISMVVNSVFYWLLPFVLTTFLFMLIFRFLPDVRMEWRYVTIGGLVTAVLFAVGKELISLYIGNSQMADFYDTAGSIIVLLLWVFYASVIFLFGAVFTMEYMVEKGEYIKPSSYAVRYKRKQVEQRSDAADKTSDSSDS